MKVLYLTPWYPSERDAMAGLFVQKHVEAVRAQGVDVRVIHSMTWHKLWQQWRSLKREGWIPDVIQLNVIQKQGLLALWLKHHYHIPYIIVEHWSGYLPENGEFMKQHVWRQRFAKRVCEQAEQVLTVSRTLEKAMQHCGFKAKQWARINNVVDEFFYEKDKSQNPKEQTRKTLLHVSCFDENAKNVKGLLRAVKILSEKRQDWRLVLVGTGIDYDEVHAYAEKLQIPNELLEWTGELTPQEVAERMHKADAFVLTSRYETYGVVLAEAAAAGLPILSTPVGIAEEVADFIAAQEIVQNKPDEFAEFIEIILWLQVASRTQRFDVYSFSSDTIGKKLKSIYEEITTGVQK